MAWFQSYIWNDKGCRRNFTKQKPTKDVCFSTATQICPSSVRQSLHNQVPSLLMETSCSMFSVYFMYLKAVCFCFITLYFIGTQKSLYLKLHSRLLEYSRNTVVNQDERHCMWYHVLLCAGCQAELKTSKSWSQFRCFISSENSASGPCWSPSLHLLLPSFMIHTFFCWLGCRAGGKDKPEETKVDPIPTHNWCAG